MSEETKEVTEASTETKEDLKVDTVTENGKPDGKTDAVTEEGKTEETTKEETKEEVVEDYVTYGDPSADAIVDIFKEAKIPVNQAKEIFAAVAETGDLSKMDTKKLTELLGESKAALVQIAAKDYFNKFTAQTQETVNSVYDSVGGKENYTKVQSWARQRAASDEAFANQMQELNALFDLNKSAALMAAKELVKMYESDPKNSSLEIKKVEGDAAASTQTPGTKMSRVEYFHAMEAAQKKGDTEEINRLIAIRKSNRQG